MSERKKTISKILASCLTVQEEPPSEGSGYKINGIDEAARRIAALAMLSASPSPGEDVVERVAALLGREIYCGQDEAAPADNPCKKTWAAYKRRCPECALHPNERTDLARAVIAALEGSDGPS